MMKRNPINKAAFFTALAIFLLAFPAAQARAQSSAVLSGGSAQVGYDNRTCVAGLEGTIRYVSASGELQYCNGSAWQYAPCDLPCTPPAGCTTVGNTCADGSIYIGMMTYGTACKPIFAADVNQSTSNAWRSSGSGSNAGTLSYEDGLANQEWIATHATIANFPAFNTCNNLVRHTRTDWYLPAFDELSVFYNSGVISTNQNFWSSTEFSDVNAWHQNMSTSAQNDSVKTTTAYVRCIRRN